MKRFDEIVENKLLNSEKNISEEVSDKTFR